MLCIEMNGCHIGNLLIIFITSSLFKSEIIYNEPQDDDDTNWSVDVSEEAVAARMQEITSGAKTIALSDDLEKTPTERANLLYTLVKTRVADGTIKKVGKVDTDYFSS